MPINKRFRSFDFSLRQVQYAVAVAEVGAFGEAAARCGVSQPSLSAQVAKLEDVWGVQLFERNPRGVLVTPAGRALLGWARALLDAGLDLDGQVQALGEPWAVPLSVGVIPTVAPYLLPEAVTELALRQPGGQVHWRELQTARCEDALAAGELDAIVIADASTQAGTADHVLGFEPFVAVVPASHPLQGPVTVAQLSSESVLLLDDGHCLRDHTMALCLEPGVSTSPYRATSLPTLVQMVSAGLGVSVLPSSAVAVEVARADVRIVPFTTEARAGRVLRVVWRERTARQREIDVLTRCFAVAMERALTERP